MTLFHLVRHGDYPLLGRTLAGRTPGHGLSAAGAAQASRVAEALAGRPIAAVVSSPLQRAAETAAPIGARLDLPVATDADLDEIDFGAWTGLDFDALHALPEWRAWNVFRGGARVPGGETMLRAQARAVAALHRWAGAEVVFVTHADVVKAIVAHCLGLPLDLMCRLDISPGSRSVVELFADGAIVRAVNLPP